jgi:hypothetical protein
MFIQFFIFYFFLYHVIIRRNDDDEKPKIKELRIIFWESKIYRLQLGLYSLMIVSNRSIIDHSPPPSSSIVKPQRAKSIDYRVAAQSYV